jgi:uncharacterized protein (TIGR03083 family)
MADLFEVYDAERLRLVDVVGRLAPGSLATQVPATPAWTIQDVVAHLSSDVAGILAKDFPLEWFANIGDPGTLDQLNSWTERMVRQRRGVGLQRIIADWDRDTAVLLDHVRGGARPAGVPKFVDALLVTDLAAHTHDIHGALGLDQDRDSAAVRIAVSFYLAGLKTWQPELPLLQIVTEEKTYNCGSGSGGVSVRLGRFELFRALSGRRSAEQIRAYDWEGDPMSYLVIFAPYGPRADALVE